MAEEKREQLFDSGTKWVLVGGVLAAAVALVGFLLVGRVYSDFEARQLIDAMSPSMRTFSFAVITASSTILALMLTLLGLAFQATSKVEVSFHRRVRKIALFSTTALILATLLLLFVSIPVQEADSISNRWFSAVYYTLVVVTAAISGLIISVVLMLYEAITGLIRVLELDADQSV